MFKRITRKGLVFALAVVIATALTVGVLAAGGAITITATLEPEISIVYNGEVRKLTDANGDVVYPISYNGTTYVPVRGVAGLFGVPVDWNGDTRSVLLGKDAVKTTKLIDLKPSNSSYNGGFDKSGDVLEHAKDKFDNVYRDAIKLQVNGSFLEYLTNNSYTKLTLTFVPEESLVAERASTPLETTLLVEGDSRVLYKSNLINYKTQPTTIEVDISGQTYVRISTTAFANFAIFDYLILSDATLS